MYRVGSKICLTAISLAIVSFGGQVMAAECGPGPHWIDDCPEGTDEAPSSATVKVVTGENCDEDEITAILSGPTVIERKAGLPGFPPADPADPGDPTHTIDTEMVSLNLSGGGITLRAGVNEYVFPASLGEIVERADPKKADSSFDVYFEIDGPFGTLHNNNALRMEAIINKVPPLQIEYTHPLPQPVPLYDEGNNKVACLVNAVHLDVTLSSFNATAGDGQVTLNLETGTESKNAAFLLWRGELLPGKACPTTINELNINDFEEGTIQPISLIMGGGTEVSGASYSYPDTNVNFGTTYCYALEDIEYGEVKTSRQDRFHFLSYAVTVH